MIHPTVRAEVGEHALTLLEQAASFLISRDIPDAARDRWLGEYREMIAHTDLSVEQEQQLRLLGVIE